MARPEAAPGAGAAALPKLQAAISDRKSVEFDYYTIARDETLARRVDPYGLQLVAGEWYLVGRCHLREAVRTFRLSRIRSRVVHATRAPHDFEIPADFDLGAFRDRPAWQLGASLERARIRVAADLGWWVATHWSHCGDLTWLEDGALEYETPYADGRALLSWALGMGGSAEVLAPEELRNQARDQLRGLRDALEAPRAAAAVKAPSGSAKRRAPAGEGQVEVDRFTRLTALAAYLVQRCGEDDEALLDAGEVAAALGTTADELRADVRLLNLVNFGGDGTLLYAEYEGRRKLRVTCDAAGPSFKRPARLSPLQADTVLLAIDLVGDQLPTASGAALATAAAKLRGVRSAAPSSLIGGDPLPPDEAVLTTVNTAIRGRHLLAITYWAEGTDRVTERTVEPYLLVRSRGEWYYVSWCRRAQGTRVFRVATTKAAHLLDETFTPRREVELDLYRREGIPTTGSYAPNSALIWYNARVRPWVAERQPVTLLSDGACLGRQPYVDENWLTMYLLRFAGEALPLEPATAVSALRDTVDHLLAAYESR
jgi:proteasome accessory factor C